MEIAFHFRDFGQKDKMQNFAEHLLSFYQPGEVAGEKWEAQGFSFKGRIYIGDDFCSNRLPTRTELNSFLNLADLEGYSITLLTPVLTDAEMEHHSPIFEILCDHQPEAEVVVNDLGMLSFVRESYPSLRLSAGRVMNKGFKDPRLPMEKMELTLTNGVNQALSDCTFERLEFQTLMTELDVERLEFDLLPYKDYTSNKHRGRACSIYFPFGYFTSGRVCLMAPFDRAAKRPFIPISKCSRPCERILLELTDNNFLFRIFQNGNSLFYLYSPAVLNSLKNMDQFNNTRLVYQGFSMGVS